MPVLHFTDASGRCLSADLPADAKFWAASQFLASSLGLRPHQIRRAKRSRTRRGRGGTARRANRGGCPAGGMVGGGAVRMRGLALRRPPRARRELLVRVKRFRAPHGRGGTALAQAGEISGRTRRTNRGGWAAGAMLGGGPPGRPLSPGTGMLSTGAVCRSS
jgi:hypothetical protein